MKQFKVKRRNDHAVIPCRSHPGDLGYDLFSCEAVVIPQDGQVAVPTGISVEFPEGWGGFIKDRSSMAIKRVYTSAGVIDNGYRGEIKVVMRNDSGADFTIQRGDKIAQLVPVPVSDWEVVEAGEEGLAQSRRDENGFGSSGR